MIFEHLSLVFSSSIQTRLTEVRVYTENTSDAWHIPRYPTRKHCITSMYETGIRKEKESEETGKLQSKTIYG